MSSSGKDLLNKSVHFHIEAESPTKNCSLPYSSLLLCPTLNHVPSSVRTQVSPMIMVIDFEL